ncbi:hypothetical protein MLD38_024362 [Melastoma candidum]|uniref:Uncharacterized protein n=1 Tax=Melastoma candidum TaxID=119954 RepID=A0ACB9NS28_9MYRT|nr:hypothetical protein MLD38_024362 [Melastoma candidum]
MPPHPIRDANATTPFGHLSPADFYTRHSVAHGSDYITNSRSIRLFTQWWTPLPPAEPVGVLAIVHGFTGHGFSEGLIAHVPDINPVVDDCISFFDSFRARFPPSVPAFLYVESLGGAIALYITLRQKGAWRGPVLNGAMCGISDKFKPPWPLEHFLSAVAAVVPTWRVVPTRGSIPDRSFKVEWKRKLALASPRRTVARPRAATALELLRICRDLQGKFEEVEVPLLIVHGAEDVVCDPACAKELYQRAQSEDKTMKVYPGMWHQLIGEPEEIVEMVFGDMKEWLLARATA